jgi:hypothetical protein
MIQRIITETQDIEISTTEIDKTTEEILITEIIGRIGTILETDLAALIRYPTVAETNHLP